MSRLHKASPDCIAFVEQLGVKLRNVVPRYQQVVLGSVHSDDLPQHKEAQEFIKIFLKVNARFNGRLPNGKPHPKGRQYFITENEITYGLAPLAQWLVNLDAISNHRASGLPQQPKTLVVDMNNLIVRERIIG
jgi:hypothetical protein